MIDSSMAAASARLACRPRRFSTASTPRLTTTPLAPTPANFRNRREKNGPSRRRRIGGSKVVKVAQLSRRWRGRNRGRRRGLASIELDEVVLLGKLGQRPVARLGFFEGAVERVVGLQSLVEPPVIRG